MIQLTLFNYMCQATSSLAQESFARVQVKRGPRGRQGGVYGG